MFWFLILGCLATLVQGASVSFNIASLMLYPTPTPFILNDNYTDPGATPTTVLQVGWSMGFQLYRDTINSLGGIQLYNGTDPINVLLNITFFNVARPTDNTSVQLSSIQTVMNDIINKKYGDYPVIVSPPQSPVRGDALAPLCESTQACILILPTQTDPTIYNCVDPLPDDCVRRNKKFGRRFQKLISMSLPSIEIIDSWIQYMINKGAKSMAIIRTPAWNAQADWASRTAQQNKLIVVYDQSFDPVALQPVQNVNTWIPIVKALRDIYKPDILTLFVGYTAAEGAICANLFLAMKAMDYFPKGLHFAASCQLTAPYAYGGWKTDNLQAYAYGVMPYTRLAVGNDYRAVSVPGLLEPFSSNATNDSPMIFFDALARRFGYAAATASATIAGQAAMAPDTIKNLLEASVVFNPSPTDLANLLCTIDKPSWYGRHRFGKDGMRGDQPYDFVQYGFNGASTIITPVAIGSNPIYPAPNWSERAFYAKYFSGQLEVAMISVTAIVQALIVGFGIMVVKYWNHAVIRAATPLMCLLVVIGSLMMSSTNYLWTFAETNGTCMGKIWTLSLGFTIAVMSIVLKTYRIWKIFGQNDSQLRRVIMPTQDLLKMLGCFCGLDVLLLIIWHSTCPLQATERIADPYRPSNNFLACSTPEGAVVLAIIMIINKALMLMIASFMAFRVRNAPLAFSETFHIGVSVYLSFIVICIIIPISATFPDRAYAYVLRSVGIIIFSLTLPTIMIGMKLMWVWFGEKDQDHTQLASSGQESDAKRTAPLTITDTVPTLTTTNAFGSPARMGRIIGSQKSIGRDSPQKTLSANKTFS